MRGSGEAEVEREGALVRGRYLRLLLVFFVVAVVIGVLLLRSLLTDVEHLVKTLGYPGIFLISLVGAGSIVVPLPSAAAIFLGGVFLDPLFVGLVAGVAEALGEITGYTLGYSGQGILENNRVYRRVKVWVQRRGWVVIVTFAAIPNPFFDFLGIAAGAMRLPLVKFLLAAWLGKSIKNVGLAYSGFVGVDWVRSLFGTAGAQ